MGSSTEFDIGRLKEAPERGENRTSMFLQAELRPEDGRTSETCRVRNVSAGGLMCETGRHYRVGERAVIVLRTVGPVQGSVVWVSSNRVGLAFDQAIDPRALRRTV